MPTGSWARVSLDQAGRVLLTRAGPSTGAGPGALGVLGPAEGRGSVPSTPICVINPLFSQAVVTICVTVQLCHRAGFVRTADRCRAPAIP